jgi:methyltransferase family protein
LLSKLYLRISDTARKRRGQFLMRTVALPSEAKILDLGGGTGQHIHAVLPFHSNITVCDISAEDLKIARDRYGFKTVQLQETGRLPFQDQEFDFCFCSSVIEHVTGPKQQVEQIRDEATFCTMARQHQENFAREVARIAKSFYVQTPYRYFFIESHTCLPGIIVLLPRQLQLGLIKFSNRFWFKRTAADYHLFDWDEMSETFPDAKIYSERYLGMTKSLMAIKA